VTDCGTLLGQSFRDSSFKSGLLIVHFFFEQLSVDCLLSRTGIAGRNVKSLLVPASPECIANEQRNREITARIPRKSGMIGVLAPEELAREGLRRVEACAVGVGIEVQELCERQSKQLSLTLGLYNE